MSGLPVTLCNTSSKIFSRSATNGFFTKDPPEVIESWSTTNFELAPNSSSNSSCTYTTSDGVVFTLEWNSNNSNGFQASSPDNYSVEGSSADGVFTVVVVDGPKVPIQKETASEDPSNTSPKDLEKRDSSQPIEINTKASPAHSPLLLKALTESVSTVLSSSAPASLSSSPMSSFSSSPMSSGSNSPMAQRKPLEKNHTPSLSSLSSFGDLAKDRVVERRDYIIMEILQSERTYVNNLITLLTTYINDLRTIPESTLPSSLVMSIFSNAEEILPVNKQLLVELEKKWENWSPEQTIGDTILKMTPFLKTYKNYTARYSEALNSLRECEKNQKFQAIVYKCIIKCRFDLDALLIQPVQRIPRYNLLLADLLKNTDESHPDYGNIERSIEEMKNISQYINESIKMNENRKKVIEIHNSMTNLPGNLNLVEPHRVFVMQDVLTKVCRKAPKKFTFFLFSDILLYADQSLDRYRCHHVFYLSKSRFIDKGIPLTFDIVSEKKSFAVLTKDNAEKDQWLSKLEANTRQIRTRRASLQGPSGGLLMDLALGEAPVWVPDGAGTGCFVCSEPFTLISRRHHCRVCGILVCGKCSPKKMRIPSLDNKNVRVCNNCFGKQKLQQILETQEA